MTRLLSIVPLLLVLSGCAGGWRNGPPAGYAGPGTPASLVPGGATTAVALSAPAAAPKAAKPAKAAGAAGAETAEGVRFVWTGGGGSANVAGEFNNWSASADPMTKQSDGSFVLVKPLAPGRYAYKFVIDGTNWKEDPGAKETVDDGYGGKNAVVVVTGAGGAAAAPAAATPVAQTGASVVFTWTGEGSTVHLAGDFNGWSTSADPLTKTAQGVWTITKALEPGTHAYKFVIDGTNWKEDPNAKETVDDGYGGKNSVVMVGAGAAAATPAPPMAAATPAAGGVTFRYKGAASSVHLAGEFNAWNTSADPLTKQADGTWTITKALGPGRYAYKFVIDGGTWKEDPNAAESVDDGYGGKNSIVVVGEGTGGAGGAPAAAPAAAGSAAAGRPPEFTAAGVRFFFPGAHRSVHLAGDFNGWSTTADPMAVGDGGLWTILKKLEPGTYGYKFVVDGTTWKMDEANSESADDGFGGKNSVVTVP